MMMQTAAEHEITIAGGEHLLVRPVQPSDEESLAAMFAQASPEDIRFRCFGAIKDFPHAMASRLTRIDREREVTLVAVAEDGEPGAILGVVHIVCETLHPDTAEYDIMIRSDHKGHGLGYLLMREILAEAGRRGLKAVEGYILRENKAMVIMAREHGFRPVAQEDDMVIMRAELSGTSVEAKPDAPAACAASEKR
jgi:acetyltransferase